MAEPRVPLADMIAVVTAQLRQAEEDANKHRKVMQFDECEIELGLEIETTKEGGLHVWVINLGGGKSKTDVNTVRIKFKPISGQQAAAFPAGTLDPELGVTH